MIDRFVSIHLDHAHPIRINQILVVARFKYEGFPGLAGSPVPLESGTNAPPLMVSRFSAPVPQPLLAPSRQRKYFPEAWIWADLLMDPAVGGVATAYMLAEDNPGISYFGGPPIADASLSSLKMDRPKSAPARVRSEFPETWIWTDLDTAAGDGKRLHGLRWC
ncbi:hypothetical protein niasHT_010726 [Heterodera trifolii]|uniref:Uncharacterized protein n=1 Tax=Heterodera trifolii TaxID=157864 RepID=A0ABD2LJQ6_9BILA